MIQVLIVDDERLARNELKRMLEAYPNLEITGEAADAEEALAMIEKLQPDLMFLDIQMPGQNGFELLKQLANPPEVIFTTAYDDYVLKAFEVDALDYLLKPIDPERLRVAVKRAEENILFEQRSAGEGAAGLPDRQGPLGADDQVFIKDGDKCWYVQLDQVRLMESEGNYVKIYFDHHKPLIHRSLNAMEARLDGRVFFRANRKQIINLKWIQNIQPWFSGGLLVHLKDGTRVEISRRQSATFRDAFGI